MTIQDLQTQVAIIAIILLSYLISRTFGEFLFRRKLVNAGVSRENSQLINVDTKIKPQILRPVIEKKESAAHSVILPRRSSPRFSEEIDVIVQSLQDSPSLLIAKIFDLCNKNYDAASAIFFKGKSMGILSGENTSSELYLHLSSSCIRVGSPHFIFKYFEEMDEMNVVRDLDFYYSIVKILTFKKFYKITLCISDQYLKVGTQNYTNLETLKSLYSCLLYSAVESKEYWRCAKFFRQIVRTGIPPSDRDLANHVQAIILREDWKTGIAFIATLLGPPKSLVDSLLRLIVDTKDERLISSLILAVQSPGTFNILLAHMGSFDDSMRALLLNQMSSRDLMNEESVEILIKQVLKTVVKPDLNLLNSLASSKTCPSNAIDLVNALIEKQHLPTQAVVDALMSNGSLAANMRTFELLFSSASRGEDVLQIYQLFESSAEVTSIEFFNEICLPVMPDWQAVKSVVDEMESKFGVAPNMRTFEILIDNVIQNETHNLFDACWQIIVTDMVQSFGIVPTISMYVKVIEVAIGQKNYAYLNLFMQGMCDQHLLSLARRDTGIITGWEVAGNEATIDMGPLSCISSENIERLLRLSLETDEECFFLLVELVLLNKVQLNFSQFTQMFAKVYNKDRLRTILAKYKYKVPIKSLAI